MASKKSGNLSPFLSPEFSTKWPLGWHKNTLTNFVLAVNSLWLDLKCRLYLVENAVIYTF